MSSYYEKESTLQEIVQRQLEELGFPIDTPETLEIEDFVSKLKCPKPNLDDAEWGRRHAYLEEDHYYLKVRNDYLQAPPENKFGCGAIMVLREREIMTSSDPESLIFDSW